MITTRLAWGNSTSIVFCFMFIQNIYQSIWFIPNVAAIPKHCGMHVCIPSAHQYVEEELPPQMFYWLGNGVPKLHVAPSGQSPTSCIIMQLASLICTQLNPFLNYWSALTVKKHPRIQSIVHFSKLHNYRYIINHFMTDRCGYLKQYPFTL